MNVARPAEKRDPTWDPSLEPHSRYSGRQQTDSGIAAVTAPGRSKPTAELPLLLRPVAALQPKDFRGGAKPIALFSLQKTAKTARSRIAQFVAAAEAVLYSPPGKRPNGHALPSAVPAAAYLGIPAGTELIKALMRGILPAIWAEAA